MILAVVGCLLSNLLVLLDTLHSLLDRLLLVLQALGDLGQDGVRVRVLLLDILHQAVDGVLGLQALLLDCAVLRALHLEHGQLVLERLIVLGGLDLEREEILLHSFEDVMVRCLRKLLLINLLLGVSERFLEHC